MSVWFILQILFNVFLSGICLILAVKLFRKPKDDPRLSRGLQLLQSKIAVLEDLSDRTEIQVKQLATLLEHKAKEVQAKIGLADRHVQLIQTSMEKSLVVARFFEDKIPHKEIIERQTTLNYVKAARLAYQGSSVEEIANQVPIPRGELEMLVKLNRNQLMFSEEDLPEWVKDRLSVPEASQTVEQLEAVQDELMSADPQDFRDYSKAFEVPTVPQESLKRLGEEFRKACQQYETATGGSAISGLLSDLPEKASRFFQMEPANNVPTPGAAAPEPIEISPAPVAATAVPSGTETAAEAPVTPTATPPTDAEPAKASIKARAVEAGTSARKVIKKVVFPNITDDLINRR